nr:MAG: hypothetical protein J07AB56_02860 [Candidatus Nanosalinarum sp. J07AB56]
MTATNLPLAAVNTIILALLLANVSITWSTGFNSFYGESEKIQSDKIRSIALTETLLETKDESNPRNSFQDGRAVLSIKNIREDASAADGHCYLPGIPRLDGENFSMYVSPVSGSLDAREACLSPPQNSAYSVSTPILVETPPNPGPGNRQTVPAILTVYGLA